MSPGDIRIAERPEARGRSLFRVARGGCGLALVVGVVLYWGVVPFFVPKTAEAWLNVPTRGVRVAQAGDANLIRRVGDRVAPGDVLAERANRDLDQSAVWRLRTEKQSVEAEFERLSKDLDDANTSREQKERALNSYFFFLMRGQQQMLALAEAKVAELKLVLLQAQRLVKLHQALSEKGAESREEYQRALEEAPLAEKRLEQSERERDQAANELAAAQAKVIIKGDSPIEYSSLRQVQVDILAIQAKREEVRARVASASNELEEAETLNQRVGEGPVIAPVAGVILRVHASAGPMTKGESLFEIGETGHAFVDASFPESMSAYLKIGGIATVRFSGLPPLTGRLRAFSELSPAAIDDGYAVRLPRSLNQVRVYIDLDGPIGDDSMIGRQCRVLVSDPSAHFPRRALEWFARNVLTVLGW